MSSATSPYVFKYGNSTEINFITTFLEKNKYSMFLRKVDATFPDNILLDLIYYYKNDKIIYMRHIKLFLFEYLLFINENKVLLLFLIIGLLLLFKRYI
jgi:hypothetical protein